MRAEKTWILIHKMLSLKRKSSAISRMDRKVRDVSRLFVIIFILFSFAESSFGYSFKLKGEWNEYKSDHFIIYHHPSISAGYIREFVRECERYYRGITDRLGFNRFNFWLWDNRAKIFMYKTKEEYVKETGRPEWSGASVHVTKKTITTYYFEKDFFDTILPHELTHIIFREFIGRESKIPLWFEEGVACANEDGCYLKYFLVAKVMHSKGIYIPVRDLDKMTSRTLITPKNFYSTAASLVIFLLEGYKKRSFVELCRELRDGRDFYGAIEKVYRIKGADDLNEKFIAFLKQKKYEDIVEGKDTSVDW